MRLYCERSSRVFNLEFNVAQAALIAVTGFVVMIFVVVA